MNFDLPRNSSDSILWQEEDALSIHHVWPAQECSFLVSNKFLFLVHVFIYSFTLSVFLFMVLTNNPPSHNFPRLYLGDKHRINTELFWASKWGSSALLKSQNISFLIINLSSTCNCLCTGVYAEYTGWAALGECGYTPNFMVAECKRRCVLCLKSTWIQMFCRFIFKRQMLGKC